MPQIDFKVTATPPTGVSGELRLRPKDGVFGLPHPVPNEFSRQLAAGPYQITWTVSGPQDADVEVKVLSGANTLYQKKEKIGADGTFGGIADFTV